MVLGRLLDRLRGVRTIHDPALGMLRTVGDAGVWEGAVPFAPTGEQVELMLDAGPGGPTAEQQRFPAELARRYAALLPEVERVLRAAAAADPSDVRLVVIDIPETGADTGCCELTYESKAGDLYSIQITAWAPRVIEPEIA